LVLLVAACSSKEELKQVAGGQSGTDSQGAYTCGLDSPGVEDAPLDQVPAGVSCSPNAEFALLEGKQSFVCKEHDVTFSTEVVRGAGARRLTGRLYSDTGDKGAPSPCYAMALDASVTIEASDGSVSAREPTTLTVDHLCNSAKIADAVQGRDGKVLFEFFQGGLFVIFPGGQTENCSASAGAIDGNAGSGGSGGSGGGAAAVAVAGGGNGGA